MSNVAGPTGTSVRLAVQNFKDFHFLVKSRLAGANPLIDFYHFQAPLYADLSYVTVSNLTRFALQITDLLLRNRASAI